jgi:hypothetical protein
MCILEEKFEKLNIIARKQRFIKKACEENSKK